MDYLQHLYDFYEQLPNLNLLSSQISLYHALLYISKSKHSDSWFDASVSELTKLTGTSKNTIKNARELLKNKCLIDYKLNSTSAASYKILTGSKSTQVIDNEVDIRSKSAQVIDNEVDIRSKIDPVENTAGSKSTQVIDNEVDIRSKIDPAKQIKSNTRNKEIDKQVFAFLNLKL